MATKNEKEETNLPKKEGKRSWNIQGITMPDNDGEGGFINFLRICKTQTEWDYNKEVIPYMTTEIQEKAHKLWPTLEPFTIKEALKMPNAESRMLAIKYIGSEKLVKELGAELIDEKSIDKTQKRWTVKSGFSKDGAKPLGLKKAEVEDLLEEKVVSFKDEYKLYKLGAEKLDLDKADGDIFILNVNCPSTGRNYYHFVEPTDDALKAVAWTFDMSKEEYLKVEVES